MAIRSYFLLGSLQIGPNVKLIGNVERRLKLFFKIKKKTESLLSVRSVQHIAQDGLLESEIILSDYFGQCAEASRACSNSSCCCQLVYSHNYSVQGLTALSQGHWQIKPCWSGILQHVG